MPRRRHRGVPDVISSHFDALIAGRGDRELADQLGADLAAARPHLKMRLYPRDTFNGGTEQFVLRDIADDLTAVLCYDLPSNVVTVTADSLDQVGRRPRRAVLPGPGQPAPHRARPRSRTSTSAARSSRR